MPLKTRYAVADIVITISTEDTNFIILNVLGLIILYSHWVF
jgi:hypothetical protein